MIVPVASQVGHGAFGLRDNLRPFSELALESASQKHVMVEARLRIQAAPWNVHSGATYVTALVRNDGYFRDVVAVNTLIEVLTRAESLADCIATAGTYFYDPDTPTLNRFVWDSGQKWDSGWKWDQFPQLYVHLLDGSNPGLQTVMAALGYYYGTVPVWQPEMGPDKLAGVGGFEDWVSATDATGWSESSAGAGWSYGREGTIVKNGIFSAFLKSTGAASGSAAYSKAVTCVAGAYYRLAGDYLVDVTSAAGFVLSIYFGAAPNYLFQNGRDIGSAGKASLAPTLGQWRRFAFDFIAPAAAPSLIFQADGGLGDSGAAYLDGVQLRRIYRYNYFEPRLRADSVPAAVGGTLDRYYGPKQVGSGAIVLIGGADLEDTFGALDAAGSEVRVRHGGAFLDGQEVLYDDYRGGFVGTVRTVTARNEEVRLECEDFRTQFHVQLPRRSYDRIKHPGLAEQSVGKRRPLLWGAKTSLPIVRISIDAAPGFGFGIYELVDTTDAPNGIVATGSVFSYIDEEAANKQDSTRRHFMSAAGGPPGFPHFSEDLAAGTLTVLKDVRPIIIDASNNKLDFDIGAGAFAVSVAAGIYFIDELAAEIKTQMNTLAGVANINCTYSNTTHKVTIARTSGTLNLRAQTGVNVHASLFPVLGFDGGSDRTGAAIYTGEAALLTDVDKQHVIRADVTGFKDDASGTYTGTANATIERAPDVLYFLLTRIMGKDPALIDAPSFVAARTTAPQKLGVYLGADISSALVVEMLEAGANADVVVDGDGRIYFQVRSLTVPTTAPALVDADYLDFDVAKEVGDVYSITRVLFNQDPATGDWKSRQGGSSSAEARFRRPEPRDYPTFLLTDSDAQNRATAIGNDAAVPRRRAHVRVKGKLVDLKPGDKASLTRTRALGGALSSTAFRLLAYRHAQDRLETEAILLENV